MLFPRVAILGAGLIGGSLGLAMKARDLAGSITAYGRSEENLRRAVGLGAIDDYHLDAAEAVRDADLVVFATPVGCFEALADEVRDFLKPGAIVIDVGSVKGSLLRRLEHLMPEGVRLVGCHPIAGSERSGVDSAAGDLFKGARCIITKTERTEKAASEAVDSLWSTVGADVVYMEPDEHERVFGLVSHFPHLVAYALVSTAAEVEPRSLGFAGPGFLDTTRIAMSSPELWREICLLNRDVILEAVEAFRDRLDEWARMLRSGDGKGLEEAFSQARSLRQDVDS